jgi:hypothetical protein
MNIEYLNRLNEHFKNSGTWGYVLFYDKIDDKKVDVCLTYESSIESVILCGDDSEIYDLSELILIDERFTKAVTQSEQRYVVYVQGEYEGVHWSNKGKMIQVNGYFGNNQEYYSDTSFPNKLLSAKTWKRKKDADNKLKQLISNSINPRKNLEGKVIEVTISISY